MTAAPVLEVDLGARVRAGFTTVPLNLSLWVGDDPLAVRAHRAELAAWVGAPVAYLHQVHGAVVHVVTGQTVTGRPPSDEPVAVADAQVTRSGSAALAVLVADCVPVLLADDEAGVVGVVHAGRRGLVAGVVPAAVAAMVVQGARPDRVRAVVGPAVCGRCYEVPAELRDEVAAVVPGTSSTTSWGTPALDLPAGVTGQLLAVGIARVDQLDACTLADHRWYSHRAVTGSSGSSGPPGTAGTEPARRAGRFAGVIRLLR